MTRKFMISAAAMFIMAWLLSFVVHGFFLNTDYASTGGMRPPADAQKLVHWIIVAQAVFGVAFAWIYIQGQENKPWLQQGIRFGIAVACLTVIPMYLIYHVVTPVSFTLAIKQIVYDTIRVLLMGIAVAWINR